MIILGTCELEESEGEGHADPEGHVRCLLFVFGHLRRLVVRLSQLLLVLGWKGSERQNSPRKKDKTYFPPKTWHEIILFVEVK